MVIKMNNNDNFIQISNKDIYDMIQKNHEIHVKNHALILSKVNITNGKVKLNAWIATTALTLVIICLGFIFKG